MPNALASLRYGPMSRATARISGEAPNTHRDPVGPIPGMAIAAR